MRWLDDVESDLKKMKVKGWKEKMRDREKWRLVVEEAKGCSAEWQAVSWHLSPSQRRTSYVLPSICVSVCISPLSFLGSGSVSRSRGSEYTQQ
jgi:hypothetical protein